VRASIDRTTPEGDGNLRSRLHRIRERGSDTRCAEGSPCPASRRAKLPCGRRPDRLSSDDIRPALAAALAPVAQLDRALPSEASEGT
jgi:hypothetical protein